MRKQILLDKESAAVLERLKAKYPFVSEGNLFRAALFAVELIDDDEFARLCLRAQRPRGRPSKKAENEN